MIRGKFLSDQWYLVGWKFLLISRTLPRGGQNWTLWFDLSFFGCVSMLVEIDYQRVHCIHITASWQMKCGHGISIISNRRRWFFLLIAMYSYRHRGTVSITKSAIDIPVVGQKDVNFAHFANWKDPKIISKMAILMTEESISIAKTLLVVGDDAYTPRASCSDSVVGGDLARTLQSSKCTTCLLEISIKEWQQTIVLLFWERHCLILLHG